MPQVPDSTRISDALAQYYVAAGLPPDGGASDKWFRVHIGPIVIPLPNPPARRRAVFFHDVNHLVTGYNNVFSEGEMEIAGFEIGAGCGPFLIAWVINAGVLLLGLAITPRKTIAAFNRGRRSGSIYTRRESREAISAMTVGQMRRALEIG